MSSSIWAQHLPADRFVTVRTTSRLLVVNVCLSYDVPGLGGTRGSLLFGTAGCEVPRSIASLAKDTCEQARLAIVLEPHVDYAFRAEGPFAVDLVGYYANAIDVTAADQGGLETNAKKASSIAAKASRKAKKNQDVVDGSGSKTTTTPAASEGTANHCPSTTVTAAPRPTGSQSVATQPAASNARRQPANSSYGLFAKFGF